MPNTTIQQGDCFATLSYTHYAWLSRTSRPASDLQTVQTVLINLCETILLLALILSALRTRTLASHNHNRGTHRERFHSTPKLERSLILATASVSTLYTVLAFICSIANGGVGWGIWRASPDSPVLCEGADSASTTTASFGALLFLGLVVPFCLGAVVATSDVFKVVVRFGVVKVAAVAAAVGHPCSLAALLVAVRPALEEGAAKIVGVPVMLGVGFGLSGFAAVRMFLRMRVRKPDEEDQAGEKVEHIAIEADAMASRPSKESMPEKKSESSEGGLDDLMREITGYGLNDQ